MNFSDLKQDTPRLVVMYKRGEDTASENFQWGIMPGLPMPALLGFIERVQRDLVTHGRHGGDCPESTFVIAWFEKLPDCNMASSFEWWVHHDVPVDSIVGMLEVVKATLISGKVGQAMASNRRQLLGPDGRPFNAR
jgi:hypothetical protein